LEKHGFDRPEHGAVTPEPRCLARNLTVQLVTIPFLIKQPVFELVTAMRGNEEGRVALTVRRGPAKGLRLELDLVRRHESAYVLGKYETEILASLAKLVQPGWTIWDVGTYLGLYSVFFSRLVGPTGAVVSIEPDPRNLERTRRNLEINGYRMAHHLNAAIGGPAGEVDFLLSEDTNSHLPGVYVGDRGMKEVYRGRDATKTTLKIACVTLDQACFEQALPRPNLIKIDIEGAELVALRYLDRLCKEVRPILLLELHNPECDAEAWVFATRTGYTLTRAEDGHGITQAEQVRGTLLCFPPN
jgi:FkbM family methyltransferase